MYKNGKMRPVEIILGIGREGSKENDRVNSTMIYMIYYNIFYKCHNVLQHNNKKQKKTSFIFSNKYLKTYIFLTLPFIP
jgi:hypothetical protein